MVGRNCLVVYLPKGRADTYRYKSSIDQVSFSDVPGFACETPPPCHLGPAQLNPQLQSGEQLPKRGLLTTLNSRELGELRSIVYSSLTLASHCLS
jgi:hypothetical protein